MVTKALVRPRSETSFRAAANEGSRAMAPSPPSGVGGPWDPPDAGPTPMVATEKVASESAEHVIVRFRMVIVGEPVAATKPKPCWRSDDEIGGP